jgi:hypothetical protein
VLVAPQFAVNAADSSAGKFWEPNGFKRFLDEAAVKLARMYGDERTALARRTGKYQDEAVCLAAHTLMNVVSVRTHYPG